jgi:hypothetical protein
MSLRVATFNAGLAVGVLPHVTARLTLGTGRIRASGWRIDHVLIRVPDLELRTERILDQAVSLEAEGQRIQTTLSDHVGVLGVIHGA